MPHGLALLVLIEQIYRSILPTPAIGGVGVLEDVSKMATIAFKNEGDGIFVIGDSNGHLGQSLWLRELHGREDGAPPPVDLAQERLRDRKRVARKRIQPSS
jgi:phosphoribosylformylglycinamidine synthase